jgi:hypothetical protein
MSLNQHLCGPRVFFSYKNDDGVFQPREDLKSELERRWRYIPIDFRGPNWDQGTETAIRTSIENLARCNTTVCVVSDAYLTSRTCMLEAAYCSLMRRKQLLLCEYSELSNSTADRLRLVLRRIRALHHRRPASVQDLRERLVDLASKTEINGGEILLSFLEGELAELERREGVVPPKEGLLYVGRPDKHWFNEATHHQILSRIRSPFSIFYFQNRPQLSRLVTFLAEFFPVNRISSSRVPATYLPTPDFIPMLLTTDAYLDRFQASFPIVGCLGVPRKGNRKSPLWQVTQSHGAVEYQDAKCRTCCKLFNFNAENSGTTLERIQDAFDEARCVWQTIRDKGHQQF